MNFSLRKALILGTLVAVHSFAFAMAGETGRSVTVRYDDLNLSSPSDIRELNRRITVAAAEVCDRMFGNEALVSTLPQRRGCIRDARNKALEQIAWPSN
jgi:UrcA family protein